MSQDLRAFVRRAEDALLGQGSFALDLLHNFTSAKPTGRDQYEVDCPACKSHNLSITTRKTNFAQCWKCGYKLGWFTACVKFGLAGDYMEYARLVGERAGMPLQLDEETEREYREQARRGDILEVALGWMKKRLFEPDGDEVLLYLRERGYEDAEIRGMQLGAYNSTTALLEFLAKASITEKDARSAGLLTSAPDGMSFGGSHVLVIPWRDALGRPIGMTCRSLEREPKRKYLHSAGLKVSEHLFNLHQVRGESVVTVVEGPIDALLLSHHGIPAVACGGTSLSRGNIEALIRGGAEALVLAMDSDGAGRNATKRIIAEAQKAELSVHVAHLPFKDPDEVIRTDGPEAMQEYVARAISAAAWLGTEMLAGLDLSISTVRDPALARCAKVYAQLAERDPLAASDFAEAIVKAAPALDAKGVRARLAGTVSNIDKLAEYRSYIQPAADFIEHGIDELEARLDGKLPPRRAVPTGFPPLDQVLGGGWQQSTLNFLLAVEKTGKTRQSVYSACFGAQYGFKVGYISLDMGQELLRPYLATTLSALSGDRQVNARDFLTPESQHPDMLRGRWREYRANARKSGGGIFVVTEGPNTLDAIAEYLDYGFTVLGWDMVWVDQLQRIAEFMLGQDKDRGLIARTVDLFTTAKKKYKKPIGVLHQIGRSGHDRPRRRDIFETSAVAQQADVLCYLWDEQKTRLDDVSNRGFVLEPPFNEIGQPDYTAPRYSWRARQPIRRPVKGVVPDEPHNILLETQNPRVIEMYVEGRIPETNFAYPFDYVLGVAL